MSRWSLASFALVVVLVAGRAIGQPADPDPGPIAMTLAELEEELQRRQQDLARYNERLAELERQNAEVRQDLDESAAVLGRQEEQVRARLITLCRLSRSGYLQLLVGARSWADLFRRARFARTLMDQELEALHEHKHQVDELRLRRQQLDQRLVAQRELQERISRYQEELEAEWERRLVEQAHEATDPYGLDAASPPPYDFGQPPGF